MHHKFPTQSRLALSTIRLWLLATCTAGSLSAQAADPTATPATARPNFVLCMTDDQGWGDVAYNGHPKLQTPVLDEMARTGLRLDRFYSASSVCSPTRGSLLTGRNPNRFGCFSWGLPLRPQEVTVAEVLQAAGYATGHFGKWHLGEVLADAPNSPGASGFADWLSAPNFFENDPLMSQRGKIVQMQGESSQVPVEAALEFIRRAKDEQKPFLAVVWFGNPHGPHEGWPELKKLYADLPPAQQNYYAEITGVDRAMGTLRNGMRKLGVAENTLLWFNSDNGAQGGRGGQGSTGGLKGRKATLYEGGIRVPGVIEWPAKFRAPNVKSFPGSTMDIMPTVLDYAQVKHQANHPQMDGISLRHLLEADESPRDGAIHFWDYPMKGKSTPGNKILSDWKKRQAAGEKIEPAALTPIQPLPEDHLPGHAAAIQNEWKLHKITNAQGETSLELYNLVEDPAEKNNLGSSD